jgi:mRNA-degrading endonuclease RelE of RelBE toxin-antitoxin system
VKTAFRESFDSDLSVITDASRLRRIRLGEYRLGFVFESGAVTFVRCLHRKEIYRYFP